MERRITEEKVTKAILRWLVRNGWKIICFDFPQSGTGVSLHPNQELRTTKNKGAIIPDIVAIRNETVVFFENKDRFLLDDFIKVEELRQKLDYSASIEKLLKDFSYSRIFYGVGLAHMDKTEEKMKAHTDKIDFAVFFYGDNFIEVLVDNNEIF